MTFTLRKATVGNYYVTMEIDKYTDLIVVKAYEKVGGLYGYPFTTRYYTDTQKATRQFNALLRKLR